jgi:ABC-type antimicrobial peptide transport system permease subunit
MGPLVRSDLGRSKRRLLVVILAVAWSVTVVVVLGALVAGVERHVLAPLLPRLPLDLLAVEPKTLSVGLLAFDTSAIGSGGLDDRAIERMRGLDGVRAVYPVVSASFPMHAEGGEGFIGHRMRTDVFATGVAPELVEGDIAQGYSFDGEKDGRVSVVVARRLLDLYNTTVASAIDKPRLSPEMVIGFEFELVLGASYARGTPDPSRVRKLTAQIVGLSDRATLVGITVPEETARRWNREQGSSDRLSGAFVRTRSPGDAGRVTHAIERAGLAVDDTAKIIGAALAIGAALIALFGGTLLLLSSFAIAQTFFLLVGERRLELAILRALGATRADLRRLVLSEASIVGVAGGLLGTAAGIALSLTLDAAILGLIPDIPFRPVEIVALPPALIVSAFLLGLVSALLGAWLPAERAASANPAAALRS